MEIISFDPERQRSEKSFIHRYSLPCVSLRDGIDSAHTIVVFDNQMAVIEADGTVCDFLGPGRYPVSAEFFPLLAEASRKSGLDVSVDLFFLQTDISWSMYFGTSNGPMYIIDPVCLVEYRLYLFGRFTLVPADLPVFFQKVRENGSCDAAAVERALTSCLNMINVRLKQNVARTIKEQGISVQALSYPLLSRYIRTTIEDDVKEYGLSVDFFYLDTLRVDNRDMARCLKVLGEYSSSGPFLEHYSLGIVRQPVRSLAFQSQPDSIACSNCGIVISATCRFCPNCGKPVSPDDGKA